MKADPQDPLPWCYTTDPNVRWEYCDCDDNQMNSKYSDYNYQSMYNDKYTGMGYGQYGGHSGYGRAYNPYTGYNSQYNVGQQGRCRVSTTIKGIVMLAYNSLWPIVYQPVTSMLVTDIGDQMCW